MENPTDNRNTTDLKYSKGVQIGDHGIQTNIYYGDDPEEEKLSPILDQDSPYLGLASFGASNAKVFYGRKNLVETLSRELEKDCLIFLLGASGSGKSSVVQAGLIPKLSTKYKSDFFSFVLVPNKNPFLSFHRKFSEVNYSDESGEEIVEKLDKNQENYKEVAVNYLTELVKALKKNADSYWLIFIDQFEEILTRVETEERFLFIISLGNLIREIRSENKLVKVVLTIRSDFLDAFMQEFPDFVNIIQSDGRKPFSLITPMTDRELKLVIKNPAATHGVNVDLDLIEEIINDFRGEARSLPLLQYTLDLLWQKDNLSERKLNQKTYTDETFGRVGGALQKQAEKIYQDFEKQNKGEIVEKIFVRLVTITSDGKRVSDRQNKSKFTTGEMGVVDDLVKKHRLLVAGRQEDMVEIAHEALIGSWQRLQDWITKYEKEIILERQLVESAQTWWEVKADAKRAISELWTGLKLAQIIQLIHDKSISNLDTKTLTFVRASVDHRQRLQKAEIKRRQREVDSDLSLANSLGRYSSVLFDTHKELEAFTEAIRAGKILQKHKAIDWKVIDALQQILNKGSEYNRLEGHTNSVTSVSFSGDGKTLASGSNDNTIKLWNVETGAEILTLTGHTNSVNSVSFSGDGKTLASGSNDNTIKLWNVETGAEILTLTGHTNSVNSVSFSVDGKTLASCSVGHLFKLWNVETGMEIHTFTQYTDSVNSERFSEDGKYLACGSRVDIKLWNLEIGATIYTFTGHTNPFNGDTKSFNIKSFSTDGKTLARGNNDYTIKLWNVETGTEICTLTGHTGHINSVSFSTDGKTLASGSDDKTIKLWNVEIRDDILAFLGHTSPVNRVSFSGDGKTLASVSRVEIKLWNVETGTEISTLTGHTRPVNSVSFSADGKILASGSDDRTIKFWNVETGAEIRTLTGHTDNVNSVSFSDDGNTLASGSDDRTIKLWNVETGAEICTLTGHTFSVISVSFSSDGKTLASGSNGKAIKLWNVETGAEIRTLTEHTLHVNRVVSFSGDGKTLTSVNRVGDIQLWNVETGDLIRMTTLDVSSNSVSFSGDGKTLANVNRVGDLQLWNVEMTIPEVHTLTGYTGHVNSVSISADGKTLASGSSDSTIKLWNVETRDEIRTLTGHTSSVKSVSFSGNSKTLASDSADNTIKLSDVDLDSLMARSCDWVRNYLTHNPNVSESDRHLCDGI